MTRTQRTPAATPPRVIGGGRRHFVTYQGRKMLIAELADLVGMSRKTLTTRINGRPGYAPMTPEQAVAMPVKRYSTPDQVADRQAELFKIVEAAFPMTVRQVFYQAEVHLPHYITKTENGYKMVQTDLVKMRKSGMLDYDWIVDNTRNTIRPYAYNSVLEALHELVRTYRRNIWTDMDCLVQVWVEKDALAGVIQQITLRYGIPLMVARGYSSLSYIHTEAEQLIEEANGRPVYVYHLGDYDAEGRDAARAINETLTEMAGSDVEINFEQLAVTPEQIRKWDLPTRPPKKTSSRAERWGGKACVELDAIPADRLRALVQGAINNHMTEKQLIKLRASDPDLDRVRELIEELE
jgi:hypothetical protein